MAKVAAEFWCHKQKTEIVLLGENMDIFPASEYDNLKNIYVKDGANICFEGFKLTIHVLRIRIVSIYK